MKKIALILIAAFAAVSGRAFEFGRTPAGLIKGARLERASDTAVKVGTGYGEILGSYWEIGSTSSVVVTGYTLTGLTTTANGVFHYLYIDRSASSLPDVTLRNATTAPTYSASLMGWYDGEDRCIGAVWVKADGTLGQFYCSSDNTYICNIGYIFTNGAVSTTWGVWSSADASNYVPANVYEANVQLTLYWESGPAWAYCKSGMKTIGDVPFHEDGSSTASGSE